MRRRVARMVAPKFLVGAVTVLRDSETNSRLLLLRQPSHHGWGLPAGLLKKNEQPAAGAARELFEETGVRVHPDDMTARDPCAIVHVVGVVDTIFFAEVPEARTTLAVDGAEVLEAAWFPMDDLPHLTVNTALLLGRFGIGPRATTPR
ncbi:NUDIX domain-containing protein [Paractinoplanes ferrugineus]|nr:NUDIX domain-containing protein [Actinoplanes ferrugineus]